MGVPCFYAYIIKNHVNIIKEINKKYIDNFYLDCNSIIYDAVLELNKQEKINNYETTLINLVIKKINDLIDFIKPTQNCIIAFDGVAPLAKLNQQRIRRFKSSYEKKILSKLENKSDQKWDTTAITPGTTFMNKLTLRLNTVKFNYENENLNVIISSSDEIGEGEHKIYEFIRLNPQYIFGLTGAQLISLVMMLLGSIFFYTNLRK